MTEYVLWPGDYYVASSKPLFQMELILLHLITLFLPCILGAMGCLQRLHGMLLKSLAFGVVHGSGISQLSRLRSQQMLFRDVNIFGVFMGSVCMRVCVTIDMYMRMCVYVHLCV